RSSDLGRTGTSSSANQPSHSRVLGGREDKGAAQSDREAKWTRSQFDLQSRSRWAGGSGGVTAGADEKLFGAHAIAELARQSRRCERPPAGSHWRTDRRGKRAHGDLDPGLQPGEYRFIRDRLVGDVAPHISAERSRDYVEFPHDWRRGGVSRALGDRDCCSGLDHETDRTRAPIQIITPRDCHGAVPSRLARFANESYFVLHGGRR